MLYESDYERIEDEIAEECQFCLGIFEHADHRGILRADVSVCCYECMSNGDEPQLLHLDTCKECWSRE